MVYYTPFRWCVTICVPVRVGGTCSVMYRPRPGIPREKTSTRSHSPRSTWWCLPVSHCTRGDGALIKWDRYSDSCIGGSQCAALAVMLRPGTPRHRQTATNACGHAGWVSRSKRFFFVPGKAVKCLCTCMHTAHCTLTHPYPKYIFAV